MCPEAPHRQFEAFGAGGGAESRFRRLKLRSGTALEASARGDAQERNGIYIYFLRQTFSGRVSL
jgi:hypothetical protein